MTIKQFVPQEVCLKCKGCCRYSERNSAWAPCLLDEEIQDLLGKDIPAASISADRRLCLILAQDNHRIEADFFCPFLEIQENKCKIYEFRPFECQVYPFLICAKDKKILLTVDLNCPYVKQRLNSKELKEYIEYLSSFLNSPKQLKILRDNPQILQAYEEVLDIVELEIRQDETE